MATEQINIYDPADTSPEALMDTVDEQRTGYVALSLTNYTSTAVPAIAIGSEIEINGALFKTLNSNDPVTVGGVADGTVYILATPSGISPDQIATFSFTATAPTWFDSKQGFYNAGGTARYTGFKMTKASASYSEKNQFSFTNNEVIASRADGGLTTNKVLLLSDVATDPTSRASTTATTLETVPNLTWTINAIAGKFYRSLLFFKITITERVYIRQVPDISSTATIHLYPKTGGTTVVAQIVMEPLDPILTGFNAMDETMFQCLTSGTIIMTMQWYGTGTASRAVQDRFAYYEAIETKGV